MILPRRPCKVSQLIYKIVNFICILRNLIESNLAISWLLENPRQQQLPEALLMLLNAHQKSSLKLFRARVRISAWIALSRSETSKELAAELQYFYRSWKISHFCLNLIIFIRDVAVIFGQNISKLATITLYYSSLCDPLHSMNLFSLTIIKKFSLQGIRIWPWALLYPMCVASYKLQNKIYNHFRGYKRMFSADEQKKIFWAILS